ncbi:glycosyltransferase family A protein [Loktanella sp. DJP18]|uniref:glycosyltransferase family A protein n=1 Tax=Loktanella sp. DJP18 TaxID=3409788 RepID=UPI003BB646BF
MAMIAHQQKDHHDGALPSWSLCIATINRLDSLEIAISCAVAQTCAPRQIIIVDAGDSPDMLRDRLMPYVVETDIALIVEKATEKSSAIQRNQAIAHVDSDIIVFTDDDAFMFPDSIETLLGYYIQDHQRLIAGAELVNVPDLPHAAAALLKRPSAKLQGTALAVKTGGPARTARSGTERIMRSRPWRWFSANVLMMARRNMFIAYDANRIRPTVTDLPSGYGDLAPVMLLPGYRMSVRTDIARCEPFNPNLLAYCPCEDLDASYRYGRHGVCIVARGARIHHREVQASRIGRMEATSLGISNVALFIRTNSDAPRRHRAQFAIFVVRRLIGEAFKDAMTRRFDFPQVRGVLTGIPRSISIFRRPLFEATNWYVAEQRRVLNRRKMKQAIRS